MANIIKHPSVILIIGGRGKGKSALGHQTAERFHDERKIPVYMLILPRLREKLKTLLPEWVNLIEDVQDAPENCLILCDEAALKFHAHKWQKKETEIMENIISISRQRKQTIIFITHITRKFSITLLDIDLLICKQPGLFHTMIERGGFKKLVEKAEEEFRKLPKEEVKKCNYVFSEDFKGFIRTGLCSYWSEELSEAFAGIDINGDEKTEITENQEVKPVRIESGLKIWFYPKDKQKVLQILSKNSTIDGELSPLGVQCSADKCFYSFDLKLFDGKYILSSKRFDLEKSIEDLEGTILVDVETAYPLNMDDVILKVVKPEKEKKKDELEEYAKNLIMKGK